MTEADQEFLEEGVLINKRYLIYERLGYGGMGQVYRAMDQYLQRTVALKVIHREHAERVDVLERFRLEAQALASLDHEGVVRVYDFGIIDGDGRPFMCMQFLQGRVSLAEIIDQGRLEGRKEVCVGIILHILEALEACHEILVVHRDIKPGNVLVDPDTWRPTLIDFGLVMISPDSELVRVTLTSAGIAVGTPYYMSPEQARGKKDQVDHRTDIYAVGVLLYEMLSGEVPFEGSAEMEILAKVLTENLPIDPLRTRGISQDVINVIERATLKQPRERYLSVREMADDLQKALRPQERNSQCLSVEVATLGSPSDEEEDLNDEADGLEGEAGDSEPHASMEATAPPPSEENADDDIEDEGFDDETADLEEEPFDDAVWTPPRRIGWVKVALACLVILLAGIGAGGALVLFSSQSTGGDTEVPSPAGQQAMIASDLPASMEATAPFSLEENTGDAGTGSEVDDEGDGGQGVAEPAVDSEPPDSDGEEKRRRRHRRRPSKQLLEAVSVFPPQPSPEKVSGDGAFRILEPPPSRPPEKVSGDGAFRILEPPPSGPGR